MLNVISIDVEEYFHAANLAQVAGPRRWSSLPSRVEQSTDLILEVLERNGVAATFFVLGWCARRNPKLVRRISDAGHEIASHGYGHRIVYTQTAHQFARDIRISKQILEDITGSAVLGYRAPNFSITDATPWAHDELVKAGYRYDSSLYPIWHPRYANPNKKTTPHLIQCESGTLIEFPLAVGQLKIANRIFRIPVAGGAYWRLLPLSLMKWGLRSINRDKRWFTSYIHPWEVDRGQPVYSELSFLTRLRHYGGTASFEKKLDNILSSYQFATLHEAAAQTFGSQWHESPIEPSGLEKS